MSLAVLRTTLFLITAALAFQQSASFGRGPGGPGPGGGARTAGGQGGNRGELANPMNKKKKGGEAAGANIGGSDKKLRFDGPFGSAKDSNQGLNGALNKLPMSQGKLKDG